MTDRKADDAAFDAWDRLHQGASRLDVWRAALAQRTEPSADLPPHTITKIEQSDETGAWTKQTVRYWNEAAVKLAVREALERVLLAVMDYHDRDTIRAMIEEYTND